MQIAFLLMLPSVPGLGQRINGVKLWVDIGPLQFQPSELLKLSVVLYAAQLLAARPHSTRTIATQSRDKVARAAHLLGAAPVAGEEDLLAPDPDGETPPFAAGLLRSTSVTIAPPAVAGRIIAAAITTTASRTAALIPSLVLVMRRSYARPRHLSVTTLKGLSPQPSTTKEVGVRRMSLDTFRGQ